MPERTEIRVEEVLEPHTSRFGQMVAVAIVFTTLLAALCGYMQARSLLHDDNALTRAQQWGALAAKINEDTQQSADLLTARDRRAHADQLRAAYFQGQDRWGNGNTDTKMQAQAWQQLSIQVDRDTAQLSDSLQTELDGVREADQEALLDPHALNATSAGACPSAAPTGQASGGGGIPTNVVQSSASGQDQYAARVTRTGYQLDALRTGANSEAAAAEKQFTRYAVSLAVLAVAVFLLGYSLTPHGRSHRKLFALMAGTFVVGASLWGIYAALNNAHKVSPQAMAAYADGRVALDQQQYDRAIQMFTCTISKEPSFGPGYQWRAESHIGSTLTMFDLSPSALSSAIADATRARELGSNDPRLLNDLSAMLYVGGIRKRDRSLLGEASELMRNAHEQDPNNPAIAFNFAEDQLVLGRPWEEAYKEAEKVALPEYPRAALAALSSLANVASSPFGQSIAPRLTAARRQMISALAATDSNPAGVDHAPATVQAGGGAPSLQVSLDDKGSATIYPGQVEFFVSSGHGFDPTRDRLYALWSRRSGSTWEALPEISGPVATDQPAFLRADNRGGNLFSIRETHGCLASGQYKVELYVNGNFAGQAAQTLSSNTLTSTPQPDMNFSYCRPSSWVPLAKGVPGLIEGHSSSSGDAGIMVVDATAAAAAGTDPGVVLRRVVDRLQGFVPSKLVHTLTLPKNAFGGGMCGEQVDEYAYPHGTMAVGIGRDAYGRNLVGIVYGPNSAFDTGTPFSANDLFSSLVSDVPTCVSPTS